MGAAKKKVYAFLVEGQAGVVRTWAECEARVKGRSARFKGFETEGAARAWLSQGAPYEHKAAKHQEAKASLPKDALYFDSGTGRGQGTEIAVTDADGVPLLHLVLPAHDLTPHGTHYPSSRLHQQPGRAHGVPLRHAGRAEAGSQEGLRRQCSGAGLLVQRTRDRRETGTRLRTLQTRPAHRGRATGLRESWRQAHQDPRRPQPRGPGVPQRVKRGGIADCELIADWGLRLRIASCELKEEAYLLDPELHDLRRGALFPIPSSKSNICPRSSPPRVKRLENAPLVRHNGPDEDRAP